MIECKLCGTECKSIRSLSKHLRDHHVGYSLRAYYDEFIAETPASCVVCGSSDVGFIGLTQGYNQTCGHKCGGTHHRAKLKNDPERHDEFVKKLSKLQTKVWADREVTGEKKAIMEKAGKSISENTAKMTPEDRKKKYGYINSLSEEERREFIDTKILTTGAHLWSRTASPEEKSEMILRRNAAKVGISVDEYLAKIESMPEKEKYQRECRILTEKNYKLFKDLIDPENKRGRNFHLDHRYSVIYGFLNEVSPEVIASPFNLEMIPGAENFKKNSKCSITLEQLMEMCNG